ncbi:MAG: hypothetical protein V1901_04020 [Patescibacteria group bacterium]
MNIKKYFCLDCKKEISGYRIKRCRSCAQKKYYSEKGHNIKCNCCACKAKRKEYIGVSNPNYGRGENVKGSKNGRWIDGRYLKKHYCIDCEKRGIKTEITCQTATRGNRRCNKCCRKKENLSIETINKLRKRWGGKNNPRYIHGNGYAPYPLEFNEDLKEKIRKRDNYECQNCGVTEEEYLAVVGSVLSIHHIDYDKTNCKEDNLITTCRKCNNKANLNRECWKIFYGSLVKEY